MIKLSNPLSAIRPRKVTEQHIAVFGERGSGKTTLLSAFYGWHQEPSFRQTNGYTLNATDTSQGNDLLCKYLNMKEDSILPKPTSYLHDAFKFDINVRGLDKSAGSIIWHDYPGGWWTESQEKDVDKARKLEAFRSLMQSDVAFLLCDAQKIKDEGDKYLRRLFKNFRMELERQKNQIKSEGNSSNLFPRTWVICLSKADLIPDETVYTFRNRVIKSVNDELNELRQVIKELLKGDGYQSLGEAFLLLSSAEFDLTTGKVKNTAHSIGLDLIPPISIFLPIQNRLEQERKKANGQAAIHKVIEAVRSSSVGLLKYSPLVGNIFMLIDDSVKFSIEKLKELENKSKEQGDSVAFIIAAFAAKLGNNSTKNIYISGKK